MGSPPQVRIFFSSPGDVKMERETAHRIVDRLQGEVGERMNIEPYFWEHEAMVATKDYQENIPEMDGFDIVVCVLWSRLGTPLHPNRHPRPDGGFFESGTEYEFFTAMQAHKLRGRPDIFVFRNSTEPRRPSRPKEAREAVDREVDRLDHFFERYFQEEQYFTGAVNVYSTLGEFEDKLTLALRSFIEGRHPQGSTGKARRKSQYAGLPYLGLAAFDFKDAPVFFGRTAQIGEVVEAFQTQELDAQANDDAGKRFVLILGSSGSGKSSLARAGVLPMLVQPGVIEGTQTWRRVIFKPGDAGSDPFAAFAAALFAPEALPELGSAGTTPAEIATLLKNEGGGGEILLRQALAQAGASARAIEEANLLESVRKFEAENRETDAHFLREKISTLTAPVVRLAVLADQLEELFTTGISDEVIAAFIDRLAALATSGRVFVLGTLRSDFYPRCLEHPKLVELMRASGTYALPAPGPGDLGQMIRQPAAAAGLTFEENRTTGEKLDELLRDAAIKDPGALPLLSYTLEQLYERRTEDGLLTLAAYHDLGGLEGAIGRRAEAIFSSLPAEAKSAFDPVWRQLVTLSEGSEPVRRRAAYDALTQSTGAPELVDALTAARLLTIDQAPDGERSVSVAHEALLRHWPRVVDWVRENLDFLRARLRMAGRLSEWLEHSSSDDYLIPSGPPLAEAEGILAKHESSLDPREISFIKKSSARVRHHDQARLRRARLIAAGALVLSILAIAGGVFALFQSKAADRERVTAVQQKVIAEDAAKAALASQTRAAYLLGIENLQAGKSREGLTSLAQALTLAPGHEGARDRLYSYHLYGLPKAIPIRSIAGPKLSRQRISGALQGPDQRIVYLTDKKAVEVFDLNTLKVVPGPWENEPDSFASVISNNSEHILNLRLDLTSRIWKTATGEMSSVLATTEDFTQISTTLDAELFVDGHPDGSARVRRISDGKLLAEWQQQGSIDWFSETPSGDIFSTSGEEIVVFDRREMKIRARRKDPDYLLYQVKSAQEADVVVVKRIPRPNTKGVTNFQFIDPVTLEQIPDSRIIEVASDVWDFQVSRQGDAIGIATTDHTAEIRHNSDASLDRIFKFETYPTKVCFSPDERLFITSTPDGTVRIFDAETTKLAFEPISHDGRLEDLSISWDGRYLLTSTAERARVWDLAVGPALSLPIVQKQGMNASNFGSGEDRYWISDSSGLQQWDLKELKKIGPPLHADSRVHGCLLDENGVQSALLWDTKNIRFARTDEPDPSKAPNWTAPDKIDFWNLSKDGKRFAATVGTTVHFIDTRTAKPISTLRTIEGVPLDTIFVKNNECFVAVLPNPKQSWGRKEVKLWSIDRSEELPIAQAEASVQMLRSSQDGRWLIAAATGVGQAYINFAILWDLNSPTTPPRSIPHPDAILNIQFNRDGSLIAISGQDQTVQVWNTESATKAANPIFDPAGKITQLCFSPDSRLLGTIASQNGESTVRAWDWKEAAMVSQPFQFSTVAESIAFTPDSRKLLAIRPAKADSTTRLLQLQEISPPPDLGIDLVALTEGATALQVSKNGLPTACDPFESWSIVRAGAPQSWFFQPPAKRDVSPAIHAPSLRWIEEDSIPIDDLLKAMPAVGLARAAVGNWDQSRLNNRLKALEGTKDDTKEYQEESKAIEQLERRVHTLVEFAERNATNDPQVCLHLSYQAVGTENYQRAAEFITRALELSPDDLPIQKQAASVFRELNDSENERKALEKLRQMEPDAANHRFRLSLNLRRTGKTEASNELLKTVVDHPDLQPLDHALALAMLDRTNEAGKAFLKVSEAAREKENADTVDSVVYRILGQFYSEETDSAIESYRKLIGMEPRSADAGVIEGSSLSDEFKRVLLKMLPPTLAKYPELAPKPGKE